MNNRVTSGIASSEGRSNDSASAIRVTVPGQASEDQTVGSNGANQNGQNSSVNHVNGSYEVPMPRQALFDGKTTWESFFQPFEALALACKWDNNEKLFRLTSCLRGEAAEYAFGQLPPEALRDFSLLEKSLESRYKEKRTSYSYLAELENRRMQAKEKLADYVADIKRLVIKGYPTADAQTREKINVRHFLKGLPDQQTGVSVGMREPATIDEARQILEMYNSLRDEVKNNRVRAVQPGKDDPQYVTENRVREFGNEIKTNIGKKIDALSQKIDKANKACDTGKQNKPQGPCQGEPAKIMNKHRGRSSATFRCYSCNEENHIARNCPLKLDQGANSNDPSVQEN